MSHVIDVLEMERKALKAKKLRNRMTELHATIKHLHVKVASKWVRKSHVNHGVANHQDEDMDLDNHEADLVHAPVAALADVHGHGQVGEVAQWQYWRGARWLFYQDEWWLYYHGEWWRQALCWLRWQPDLVQ